MWNPFKKKKINKSKWESCEVYDYEVNSLEPIHNSIVKPYISLLRSKGVPVKKVFTSQTVRLEGGYELKQYYSNYTRLTIYLWRSLVDTTS